MPFFGCFGRRERKTFKPQEVSRLLGMVTADVVDTAMENITLRKEAKEHEKQIAELQTTIDNANAANQQLVQFFEGTRDAILVTQRVVDHWRHEVDKIKVMKRPIRGYDAPRCDICIRQFTSDDQDTCPRLLACGHTLCQSCAGSIIGHSQIECPFDRATTELPDEGAQGLPKNFAITAMIEQKKKKN